MQKRQNISDVSMHCNCDPASRKTHCDLQNVRALAVALSVALMSCCI